MAATREQARETLERAFRDEGARILAGLARTLGNLDLAEDALQEALALALRAWPRDGVPDQPAAWLRVAARNKAIDGLRRDKMQAHLLAALEADHWAAPGRLASNGRSPQEDDDLLTLIFTCCHPALAPEARVALTLRAVGGLSTKEIARAFLVPEVTLSQRLVRAKRKILTAGISFRPPAPERRVERLGAVLAVLYLIFNEGYLASSGESLVRADLSAEAIRLARMLAGLLPSDPEVLGLLSLMLLHDSRRQARADANGDLVTMEEQDRSLWDANAIREGFQLLERALSLGEPGPYQVQATIAAEHARAGAASDTDWRQIAAFYSELMRMTPTPVVALNRAAAAGMAYGPEAGLELLDELAAAGDLDEYYLLHAARADLFRRAGRRREAAAAYEKALTLCGAEPERRYLRKRLEEVNDAPSN